MNSGLERDFLSIVYSKQILLNRLLIQLPKSLKICSYSSELLESLLGATLLGDLQHVEADSFGQRSTLTNSHYITQADIAEENQ